MTKEDFTKIIKSSVEDVWIGRRSLNPMKEQTEMLVESLWPIISNHKDQTQRVQELQDEIKKWSDGTFGKHRTATPMAYHLKKEIDELIDALNSYYEGTYTNSDITSVGIQELRKKQERILYETADCLMLLVDCAAHASLNMDDVLTAMARKLEINKARKWGEPDENGVVEHIHE